MAPKSGKAGAVSWNGGALADVTDITFNDDLDVKEYASSTTGEYKSRVAGHSDRTGSFVLKSDAPGFVKGAIATLLIKSDVGTTLYNARSMILNIKYRVPVESGDIIESTVEWGACPV